LLTRAQKYEFIIKKKRKEDNKNSVETLKIQKIKSGKGKKRRVKKKEKKVY
jgi:hypothetical protein